MNETNKSKYELFTTKQSEDEQHTNELERIQGGKLGRGCV